MDVYTPNPANDSLTINVPDDVTDDWTASIINTPTETLADNNAYLRLRLNRCSNNWPHPVTPWTGTQVGGNGGGAGGGLQPTAPPVWDPCYGRWVGLFRDGTFGFVEQSFEGYQFTQLTEISGGSITQSTLWGLIVRPTDGGILFVGTETAGSAAQFNWLLQSSGLTSAGAAWTDPGVGHWFSGGWFSSSGGLWVVWKGGSTDPPKWSADASTAGGLAFSNATTWAPPAGFTVHDRAHLVIANTSALIFPSGTAIVTTFMATIDGKNWTPIVNMPALIIGESVIDAAYDSFSGVIYLLTGTSGGGAVTRLWSTPIGSIGGSFTWTLVSSENHQSFALAAVGRELVMWITLPGEGFNLAATYRGIASTDAGVTWSRPLPVGTSQAPGNNFALCSSDGQFLYTNTNEYAASSIVIAPPALGI